VVIITLGWSLVSRLPFGLDTDLATGRRRAETIWDGDSPWRFSLFLLSSSWSVPHSAQKRKTALEGGCMIRDAVLSVLGLGEMKLNATVLASSRGKLSG
jgi:hypothetical protein